MVFIIDDVMYLAASPFIFILEQIRNVAYREIYDIDKINDEIKENALLYELGEITKKEYEKKNEELQEKLEIAMKVREMGLFPRMDILGIANVG